MTEAAVRVQRGDRLGESYQRRITEVRNERVQKPTGA